MRGRLDHLGDRVLVLEFGPGNPPATAALRPELFGGRGLHVPGGGHREHQWVVVDEILDVELTRIDLQARTAGLGKGLAHLAQLVDDDLPELVLVAEDLLQTGDGLGEFGLFRLQIGTAETGEPTKLHVENVVGLDFGKGNGFSPTLRGDAGHERFAGRRAILACADRRDDLVNEIEGLDETFDDVQALFGNIEAVLRAAGDDIDLVIDIGLQRIEQVECARHTTDEGDHVDAEARLQRRGLPEVVEYDLGVGVSLERDHEAGVVAGRFIVDVANAFEFTVVDQLGNLASDGTSRDLIGQFGDDDRLGLAFLLDLDLRPHLHRTPPGAIRGFDPDPTEDLPARREVRTSHELHQVIDRGVGIPQQVHHRCADLVEVVRRNIGGHADGNALHPVDQQVGEASRQNRRLLEFGRIVVGEVDGVLIDVGEHLHRQRTEPAFGVSVGGRRILGRAVVAVEGDQRVTQRERLCHSRQRVVDRRGAVRMETSGDIARDAGALHKVAIRPESLVEHSPEDPTVNRLEAVAHVRKCTADDDRHRIVEEGGLHFLLNLDDRDVIGFVGVVVDVGGWHVAHDSAPQKSRFRTSRALVTMKFLRCSTSSPMRIDMTSSAIAACSTETCSRDRLATSIVVSRNSSQSISPRPFNRWKSLV